MQMDVELKDEMVDNASYYLNQDGPLVLCD